MISRRIKEANSVKSSLVYAIKVESNPETGESRAKVLSYALVCNIPRLKSLVGYLEIWE